MVTFRSSISILSGSMKILDSTGASIDSQETEHVTERRGKVKLPNLASGVLTLWKSTL